MGSIEVSDDKPCVHIGIVGHDSHGKTTLFQAIRKVLAKPDFKLNYKIRDTQTDENKSEDLNISSTIEYVTANRCYIIKDWTSCSEFIKSMILGDSHIDGAIYVMSAVAGPAPQKEREHILLANKVGINNEVVYLNKLDFVDPGMIKLVTKEIQSVFNDMGFDSVPIIRGSAQLTLHDKEPEMGAASIIELLRALDKFIPLHHQDVVKPFLLYIDESKNVSGKGTVVTGRLERGSIVKGQDCEIVGYNKIIKTTVECIEKYNHEVQEDHTEEQLEIVVSNVQPEDISKGMVLSMPGVVTLEDNIEAHVYMLNHEECSLSNPLESLSEINVMTKAWDHAAQVIIKNKDVILPGENSRLQLKFSKPMAIELGQKFGIRNTTVMVGMGVIVKILPKLVEN